MSAINDVRISNEVSIFLALLSASRVSDITNMRVDYRTKHPSVYTFSFSFDEDLSEEEKTSSPSKVIQCSW